MTYDPNQVRQNVDKRYWTPYAGTVWSTGPGVLYFTMDYLQRLLWSVVDYGNLIPQTLCIVIMGSLLYHYSISPLISYLTCSCLCVTSVMRFVIDTDVVGWAISRSIAPKQNWMKLRDLYSLRHIGWQSVQFCLVTDEVGIQWQPVDVWSDSHLPAAKSITLFSTTGSSCRRTPMEVLWLSNLWSCRCS